MRMRAKSLSGYSAFERRIRHEIHGFWRDHDHAHLRAVAVELDHLPQQEAGGQVVDSKQWILIRGWAANRTGLGLRRLRSLNPEYRISITRKLRSDIPRSRYSPFRKAGFQIVARGPHEASPFTFELSDFLGKRIDFRASNSEAEYKLGFFGVRDGEAIGVNAPGVPGAYVDEVITSTVYTDNEPATWFSALVHRNPEELFSFIDNHEGTPFARNAAEVLGLFPANARWADRFSLSAFGETASFTSDLSAVGVWRLPHPEVASKMTVPDLVIDGLSVRAEVGSRPMPCPNEEWLRLENVAVMEGAVVYLDGRIVVYEDAADPRYDFVAGQWDSVFGSQMSPDAALLRMTPASEDEVAEGILLAGRNDSNWYHWVIEYLPRLFQLSDDISPEVPLLVTSRTPATGIELLRTLTTRPVFEFDPARALRVSVLHVVTPPVQVLDTTEVSWAEGISMNPAPLRLLRDHVLEGVSDTAPVRRVFLRRNSGHRGLDNEPELARIAHRLGLEQVDPATLTWQQQLELFASTSLLVGAGGAVMANYLFMPSGSRILALTSSAVSDFVLPAAIAEVAGIEFSYLTGPTSKTLESVRHRREWVHSSFTIDPVHFEEVLIQEIAAVRRVPFERRVG